MAKIIMIDTGTKRNNNNIGDIVAIHDDDVELNDSYNTFKIVEISGTAQEIKNELNTKIPEIVEANEIKEVDGKDVTVRTRYYNDGQRNIEITETPKYSLNILNTAKSETLFSLSSKTTSNLKSLNKDNLTVSV